MDGAILFGGEVVSRNLHSHTDLRLHPGSRADGTFFSRGVMTEHWLMGLFPF